MKFAVVFLTWLLAFPAVAQKNWTASCLTNMSQLDDSFPGDLGIFVKSLKDGSICEFQADKRWYLASTIKIPVAIALLKEVEKGHIDLQKKLTLKQSDYVDGAGDLLWQDPGKSFTVQHLLRNMLEQSDSTATDMLIKLMGIETLNKTTHELAPDFAPLTTILQVRYDAYSEIHPKARTLSNIDFIELKKFPVSKRYEAFVKRIQVPTSELKATSIEEAFEKYYARGLNSTSLRSFGSLLEKLSQGQILNKKHTELVLTYMQKMKTGENRLKAGLPNDILFAQKTGTQVARMCNVGIVTSKKNAQQKTVIVACAEKYLDQAGAEKALKKMADALTEEGAFKNF
ncbi:hypothetical protein AZI87_13855 [Bdellovibrio bacteriovorus]|uniref:Beta-lactamase class A catalytic domain-containing protein n=1 Tax=Bdellovibrio bacteriovorus TaxID=959 RepID=A0A161PRC4_BDEBC|nr:serine hydrolase [Bdellovibrio bacteriovorus]KYG64314.1 hypothetical protein AZI87_13855 [Bdellovibrio bacteriovorus]